MSTIRDAGTLRRHHPTNDPPLTLIVCPVMYEAPSPHRNEQAAATSSPVPMRPTGTLRAMTSLAGTFPSACCCSTIGVKMTDGAMLLTVIPVDANSRASVLVSAMTPPFDEA